MCTSVSGQIDNKIHTTSAFCLEYDTQQKMLKVKEELNSSKCVVKVVVYLVSWCGLSCRSRSGLSHWSLWGKRGLSSTALAFSELYDPLTETQENKNVLFNKVTLPVFAKDSCDKKIYLCFKSKLINPNSFKSQIMSNNNVHAQYVMTLYLSKPVENTTQLFYILSNDFRHNYKHKNTLLVKRYIFFIFNFRNK